MEYHLMSIVEKSTKKRRPLVIFGSFVSRDHFIDGLKQALHEPEEYDFRTIRLHESWTPGNNDPQVITLHEIDDELTIN